MTKITGFDRHFSVCSDVRNFTRCYIVYDDFAKDYITGCALADLITELSGNMDVFAFFRKEFFLVDKQVFQNCLIFEVAFCGPSTNLDKVPFEYLAATEMLNVLDYIAEKYGAK